MIVRIRGTRNTTVLTEVRVTGYCFDVVRAAGGYGPHHTKTSLLFNRFTERIRRILYIFGWCDPIAKQQIRDVSKYIVEHSFDTAFKYFKRSLATGVSVICFSLKIRKEGNGTEPVFDLFSTLHAHTLFYRHVRNDLYMYRTHWTCNTCKICHGNRLRTVKIPNEDTHSLRVSRRAVWNSLQRNTRKPRDSFSYRIRNMQIHVITTIVPVRNAMLCVVHKANIIMYNNSACNTNKNDLYPLVILLLAAFVFCLLWVFR